MKYIITGATGHLGNNLVKYLLSKNQSVKILIRNLSDPSIVNLDCEKVVGDITDKDFLEQVIEKDAIVIHSAGIIDITNKKIDQLMKVNFEATVDLVQVSIKKGIKKFIYISSTDAINQKDGVVKEPSSFDLEGLNNYYAISKAMASDYVLKAINQKLLKGTIICPSCILGVNDFKVSAQGSVVKNQINKKRALSTKGHYNFVDVEKVVDAIYNASIIDTSPVLLTTGRDIEVKDLFKIIFEKLNRKPRIIQIPLWIVKIGLLIMPLYYKMTNKKPIFTKVTIDTINQKICFDHSLADKEIGYQETDINDLIGKTIEWFKHNQ